MPRADAVASLSRRATLARLSGGGLGLVLAAHRFEVTAQDTTPAASPAALPPVIGQADAVRAFALANFAAFSDIRVQPQAAFQGDDWAVPQALFAGRYTGQLPGLPAGAGQPFSIPFATIFRMHDGRIEHNTDYFDLYALLLQIGVLPAPSAATPEAATSVAATEAQTVEVRLNEMTITASLASFTVGVPYTFVVTNAGQVEHEMVIEHRGDVDKPMEANGAESEAPDIEPGKTKTLTWTFTEPGAYQLGCHVPGHYEAGMVLPIDGTA